MYNFLLFYGIGNIIFEDLFVNELVFMDYIDLIDF